MRDIVETIQAEQDHIIRADLGGVLVVQGGPGTGKTAVALHRAAYLLYTYRQQLSTRACSWSVRTRRSCATSRRCCRRWPRPACCWPPSATCSPAYGRARAEPAAAPRSRAGR